MIYFQKSILLGLIVFLPFLSQAQVNLDSGLQAYYPFTFNPGDSSGNNNHGALFGGASINGSLMTGNNAVDRMSLPHILLDGATDFAISAEVVFETAHTGPIDFNTYLSVSGSSSFNELLLSYDFANSDWQFVLQGNQYRINAPPTPSINIWQHLVFQRSGDLFQWFRNGVCLYEAIIPASPLAVSSGGLILGQEQDAIGGNFDSGQSLAGEIDNLRIYHRALSPAEIDSLNPMISEMDAQAGIANFSNNDIVLAGNQLIIAEVTNRSTADLDSVDFYWAVDGILQDSLSANVGGLPYGQSTDVPLDSFLFVAGQSYDISIWTAMPNGQQDQIANNDSALVLNVLATEDTNRYALYTDGQTGYANLNTVARDLNGLNIFTIEYWMKTEATDNVEAAFPLAINQQNRGNELLFGLSGSSAAVPATIRVFSGTSPSFVGSTIIADGSWHHIAFVQQGTTADLYVDGLLEGSFASTALLQASNDWSVGQEYDNVLHSNFYKGYLDELRVWALPRTQAQIQATMTDNSTLYQELGLVSAWHFDPYSPDIVYDRQSCNRMFVYEGAELLNAGAPVADYNNDPITTCECDPSTDLDTWDQKGELIDGEWEHDPSGISARQLVNTTPSDPIFLVSPEGFINVRVQFTAQVSPSNDNDLFGFVFGYQGPDVDPFAYDFWLFDWRAGYQLTGTAIGVEGKILSRVQGNMAGIDPFLPFWGHQAGYGLTVIDSITGSGTGWEGDSIYEFTLTYTDDRAIIEVDGDTLFDHTDEFQKGRIGFYALSQRDVVFSNFRSAPFAEFVLSDDVVCEGQSASFQFPSNFSFDNVYDWTWDHGDGSSSSDSSSLHSYPQAGVYFPSLTITDEYGCSDTMTQELIVETPPQPSLGPDTLICEGDSFLLSSNQAFAAYQWSTGASDSAIVVVSSGLYVLTVTSESGCVGLDSIFVGYKHIKDCRTLGVEESFQKTVQIYPNPSSGHFTIESPQAAIQNIQLFDLTGRELEAHMDIQRHEARVSSDYKGIVLLKIHSPQGQFIEKILLTN